MLDIKYFCFNFLGQLFLKSDGPTSPQANLSRCIEVFLLQLNLVNVETLRHKPWMPNIWLEGNTLSAQHIMCYVSKNFKKDGSYPCGPYFFWCK